MRCLLPTLAAAVLVAGCSQAVPFTPDLRTELGGPTADLSGRSFLVLGQFELRTAGRATIVVKHRAITLEVTGVDDSTLVALVLGAQVSGDYDTLRLTFVASQAKGGSYTLRAISDTPLGGSISVGGAGYQYVPCYQNVGVQCVNPIAAGAREDQGVRLGMVR